MFSFFFYSNKNKAETIDSSFNLIIYVKVRYSIVKKKTEKVTILKCGRGLFFEAAKLDKRIKKIEIV